MVVDLVETWSELHAAAPRPAVPQAAQQQREVDDILWLVGGWTNPLEKYARQNGNLPQIFGVKIRNIWNHHPDDHLYTRPASSSRDLLIPPNGGHFLFALKKITKHSSETRSLRRSWLINSSHFNKQKRQGILRMKILNMYQSGLGCPCNFQQLQPNYQLPQKAHQEMPTFGNIILRTKISDHVWTPCR